MLKQGVAAEQVLQVSVVCVGSIIWYSEHVTSGLACRKATGAPAATSNKDFAVRSQVGLGYVNLQGSKLLVAFELMCLAHLTMACTCHCSANLDLAAKWSVICACSALLRILRC
jgi:hypothetical protein